MKLDDVFEMFDLSTNVQKQGFALGTIRGPHALMFLGIYVFIAIALAFLSWRFDFEPTLAFATVAVEKVTDSTMAGWIGAIAALSITALPTLAELGFLPLLARADVKVARWGMLGLLAFDALTDAPEAYRFVSQGFGPLFEFYFNQAAPAVVYAGFLLWVLLATMAFEFLLMLALAGMAQLFWQVFSIRAKGGYRASNANAR